MRSTTGYTLASVDRTSDRYLVALMQDYLTGEPGAFRELYREVGPTLYSYLNELCNGEERLAQHLLKQTFLEIHNTRTSYCEGNAPMHWFRAIAERCFQEHTSALAHGRTVGERRRTLFDWIRQLWRRRGATPAANQADGRSDAGSDTLYSARPDHSSTQLPRLAPT